MLDSWLRSLSKNALAYGSIAIALILILILNPPHTICDTQIGIFKEEQVGMLFPKKEKGGQFKPKFGKLLDRCKASNSAGGCYELFEGLRELQKDLQKIPKECTGEVSGIKEIKQALNEGLKLMTQIAWGSKPPTNARDKNAWFSRSDLALFCSLKRSAISYLGDEYWNGFQESMFRDLPDATKLSRKEIWEKMILSSRCESF
jgi:hypothetical protein